MTYTSPDLEVTCQSLTHVELKLEAVSYIVDMLQAAESEISVVLDWHWYMYWCSARAPGSLQMLATLCRGLIQICSSHMLVQLLSGM